MAKKKRSKEPDKRHRIEYAPGAEPHIIAPPLFKVLLEDGYIETDSRYDPFLAFPSAEYRAWLNVKEGELVFLRLTPAIKDLLSHASLKSQWRLILEAAKYRVKVRR